MSKTAVAKFAIGQVIRHREYEFRGVVFDVDPEFSSDERWYNVITVDTRPRKDQPFYYLLADNEQSPYIAYVPEQNLEPDLSGEPVQHPRIGELFEQDEEGRYRYRTGMMN